MTPRQQLLAVYTGGQPDTVPALADLSYWHAGHGGGKFIPGKTDGANRDKVAALLALHRHTGAAIHVNLGSFYRESFPDPIRVASGIRGESYFHRFETPVGTVEERREWSPVTFSWPITHPMIQGVEDLKVIRYVFERIRYAADWELFHAVDAQVGDLGLPLVQVPYTGLGFFLSRYAGVERTVLLAADEPAEFAATLAAINTAHARACRLLAEGPSQVLIHSDNLSSDTHSPPWVRRYSGDCYRTMTRLAHDCGKPIVTHIDGRLRGLLQATRELGFDGADAATPAPWGDLTPAECRAEAGPGYILSGGVPPGSFHASVPLRVFDEQVEAWLDLRRQSPALIIAPGDQLPPDGELDRVTRLVARAAAARL
ncbi:MAG: uroporphyrinogen decarboxylase family protein [Verrucomicrobiota bacterium]